MKFVVTTSEEYHDMLGALPPAFMAMDGFLVGEAMSHKVCNVTKSVRPSYTAFFEITAQGDTRYFKAEEAMTIPEFRTVTATQVLTNAVLEAV